MNREAQPIVPSRRPPAGSYVMNPEDLSIAAAFSRFPAGRYKTDGPNSGERFRDDVLFPLLESGKKVLLQLDGTLGYGSSFLEEAFGGLIRERKLTPGRIRELLTLQTSDKSLEMEIWKYIDEAGAKAKK